MQWPPGTGRSSTGGPGEGAAEHVVSLYQSQQKIHPRSVKGCFVNWRRATVWLTQLVFCGLPWRMWNKRQAVPFDLGTRRIDRFGLVLDPQDFIHLTALLIVAACALFLFTAVTGRLWCGCACPQTVYTAMLMWVERQFEGDRAARLKRDSGPWTLLGLRRAAGKHAAWIATGR